MAPLKEKQSFFEVARALAILGGVLTSVGGVLGVLSLFSIRTLPSLDSLASTLALRIMLVLLGLVAIGGSRHVKDIAWNIVLVIVGALAYSFRDGFPWEWGSVLIILGGVVGIVSKLA